jgi:diguanylate cyclase (GGDEF)-like protein
MEGHIIRKRSGRKITMLATSLSIGILLVGGLLLYLSSGVRDAWSNFSTVSTERTVALSELHRAIGYGGFIHNFKNYVLRREPSLLEQLKLDLDKSFSVVDTYLSLELNSEEKKALSVIRTTFLLYASNIDLAKTSLQLDLPIHEVDGLVRIDDTPALNALGVLQEETERYNHSVSSVMGERIALLINVLLLGLLSLPFIVMIAHHYHDVMNSFLALIHEKQKVERELENVEAQAAAQHTELTYEANHCDLTRVSNRKAFMQMGQAVLDNAKITDACFTVLFVDVDDFKLINDKHGHEVGDKVLIEIAARLKDSLNKGDIVARIGGDEFAAILQCSEGVCHIDETIERLFSSLNQSYECVSDGLQISCSVGGAAYPQEGESLASLIKVADQHMYRVKKNGKNGIYLSEV